MDPALEGGEEPFEGAGRLFKVNPRVLCAEKGDDWGQHKFRFFGRRPAAQPDYGEALRALRGFIEPFRKVLNPLLVGLVGTRDEASCSYSSLTLYWTVILGFFQHLRSRNQMDATRNARAYSQTVFELSGVRARAARAPPDQVEVVQGRDAVGLPLRRGGRDDVRAQARRRAFRQGEAAVRA